MEIRFGSPQGAVTPTGDKEGKGNTKEKKSKRRKPHFGHGLAFLSPPLDGAAFPSFVGVVPVAPLLCCCLLISFGWCCFPSTSFFGGCFTCCAWEQYDVKKKEPTRKVIPQGEKGKQPHLKGGRRSQHQDVRGATGSTPTKELFGERRRGGNVGFLKTLGTLLSFGLDLAFSFLSFLGRALATPPILLCQAQPSPPLCLKVLFFRLFISKGFFKVVKVFHSRREQLMTTYDKLPEVMTTYN